MLLWEPLRRRYAPPALAYGHMPDAQSHARGFAAEGHGLDFLRSKKAVGP